MKKLFSSFLYGCIAISGSIPQAQAQDLAFESGNLKNKDATVLALASNTSTTMPLANVNTKVIRQFTKFYKEAQNVKWYKANNGYLAMFDWTGVKAHAFYGKHGYWYYDVRFGTEKDLPKAERRMIKSNYVDYSIGSATEVNLGNNRRAWVINLEDADNLVIVRIIDGSMDELASYPTHTQVKTHRKARIVIPQ
jgi:hypothetical protein